MPITTDIAIRKTLDDYCAKRDLAIRQHEQALALHQACEKTCEDIHPHVYPRYPNRIQSTEEFAQTVDARLWRIAFDLTGLRQYMDAQAIKDFEATLEKNPPAFTLGNATTALLSAAQDADIMFARGVDSIFRSLSKDHWHNTRDVFRINPKAILSYACERGFDGKIRLRYSGIGDTLNDLDRVFQTLDGKKHQPRALECAINGAFKQCSGRAVYEDAYYKVAGFANGSLHITFKRQDLLDKANRIIGEYHQGRALADAA